MAAGARWRGTILIAQAADLAGAPFDLRRSVQNRAGERGERGASAADQSIHLPSVSPKLSCSSDYGLGASQGSIEKWERADAASGVVRPA